MGALYTYALLLFLLAICYKWRKISKLPPGPIGLPIVGNMLQIPTRSPWKKFDDWHRVYGSLFCLQIGQATVIRLGTHHVAKDLLGKRSKLYSSRPRLVVAEECVARHKEAALLPYGERWMRFHTIQMSFLNSRKSQLYRPLQELESRHLLFNLLSTNDYENEFYRYSASLISTLLYSRRFIRTEDPELEKIERLASAVFDTSSPGKWLVDTFPILNYLPRPLATWKILGDRLHIQQSQLHEKSFSYALDVSSWNWCKQSLLSDSPSVPREELPFVIGEAFGAGSRTTAGALNVAVLACVSYPNTMRRAQEELDMQVGSDRLPKFDDIPYLPYTRSFVQETLRWRPLTAAGVAHSLMEDDEYDGFHMPKGATVVADHWSLDMDREIFQFPEHFIPERWMEDTSLPLAAFGFGKRVCPGLHVARNSLLLVISRLLWAFDIKWKEGQAKTPADVGLTYAGIFSKPSPFEAILAIRTPSRQQVVRTAWEDSNNDVEGLLDIIGQKFSTV